MNDVAELLSSKRALFESYISTLPRGNNELLKASMSYSLGSGGKRLRPTLFLLTAELYGHDSESLLPFAAGLEMIHTYSLIHDDLPAMDNDDYRRGKLTNHKVYGEAQAILAGDALLTEAFYMMTTVRKTESADLVLEAVAKTADLVGVGGMVQGQTLDIAAEGKHISLAELQRIHHDKTGALIAAAVVCGGILGGASADDRTALEKYGYGLGLIFQIADDILDHEGTFAELGKPIGSDEANGKTTYISLLGLDGAKAAGAEAIAAAKKEITNLAVDAGALNDLCDMVFYRKR